MSERRDTQREAASLAVRLRERIKREGPISFRDWMAAALYDEEGGYYSRPGLARWGRAGDYRTGPEQTPLFAAAFARYFVTLYEELGAPAAFTVFEAGAGAGDFALGVLETLRGDHEHVFRATRYVIDEPGAASRARLRERLTAFSDRVSYLPLKEVVEPLPHGIIFSNELLDAFPVHRVCARGGKLLELCVGLNEGDQFVWAARTAPPELADFLAAEGVTLAEGQHAEINLAAGEWIARAASAVRRGYVVTVDYGAESADLYGDPRRFGGTLRAFRRHRLAADVLDAPGEQDLTTTVNWTQARSAGHAAGLRTKWFGRLDEFLLSAGAFEVLERLTGHAESETERIQLRLGAREMLLPGGMSQSFQVLVQEK